MNYTEMIQKLKEAYKDNIDDFAWNSHFDAPDDFKPSAATQQLIDEHTIALKKFNDFRTGGKMNYQSDEYINASKEYSSVENPTKRINKEYLEHLGIGGFEEVEQYGGEGEGITWYSVKYFPKHDIYIKVSGYYTSYNGTEFYDGFEGSCSEVRPEKVEVTQYNPIK